MIGRFVSASFVLREEMTLHRNGSALEQWPPSDSCSFGIERLDGCGLGQWIALFSSQHNIKSNINLLISREMLSEK